MTRNVLRAALLSLSLGFAALAAPAPAAAQTHTDSVRFDVHLDFGWYSFVAAGFRVDIPIVAEGLISSVDDELAITLGADVGWFYHKGDSGFGVYPVLAFQWNFYLSEKWSIFPELGVAFLFGPNRNRYWGTFAAPHGGFGVRYHFNDRNALLMRVTWPGGFQVGLTF